MTAPRTHSERRAELIAERLRVIGQPLRIQLIEHLAKQPTTAHELIARLETTQQNVSQHLGILQRAGIVTRQKEGTRVRYELVDPHVLPLLETAAASLAHSRGEPAKPIEPEPRS